MDTLTKILGGIMIVVIFVVIVIVRPPLGLALKETVMPTAPMSDLGTAIPDTPWRYSWRIYYILRRSPSD